MKQGDLEYVVFIFVEVRRVYIYVFGFLVGLVELLLFWLLRFGLIVIYLVGSGYELLELLMYMQQEDMVLLMSFICLLFEVEVILDYVKEVNSKVVFVIDCEDFLYGFLMELFFYVSCGELGEFYFMVILLFFMEQLVFVVGLLQKELVLFKLERFVELCSKYVDKLFCG